MGISTVLCLHDLFPMPWCFKDRQGAVLLPLGQGWRVGMGRCGLGELHLVGGDWNHGILWLYILYIGNVIIPTVTHSIMFQRGRAKNHQPIDLAWDFGIGNCGFSVNQIYSENRWIHDDGYKMIQVKSSKSVKIRRTINLMNLSACTMTWCFFCCFWTNPGAEALLFMGGHR